ncbi:MAG: selenide, water dikinase SelD, partial [Planctomycetota bacterium]
DPSVPALVQTVDFFPPVVDEPELYGAIAAANALSDVYAMGGRPLSALTLASFPKDFDADWIDAIMRGGFAKVREAGAVVAGGHTVEGELQFGFSVTGLVDPKVVTANSGAAPGDVVFLTKPLGMGTMTTAAKFGKIDWPTMRPAAEQMATLNGAAAEAMVAAGSRAATDVTGFGLMGHGRNLARGSGVTLVLFADRLPIFPGALELARNGVASGGSKRGRANLDGQVRVGDDVDAGIATIAFDSETSGGLLVAVPAARQADFERECAARDQLCARVGVLEARSDVAVSLLASEG